MLPKYPFPGKIKSREMKVNCLIQAQLGCLQVQDFSLQQDTTRIFRIGIRIARCLVEIMWLRPEFTALSSAVNLCKSFNAKLWEDSKYVSKQLEGIGPTLSSSLVNSGITTFQKIEETHPRDLELIVNRHVPFGKQIQNLVAGLPKYELTVEQTARYSSSKAEILVTMKLANRDQLLGQKQTASDYHCCIFFIGDEDNKTIYKRKSMDKLLLQGDGWTKKLEIQQATKGPVLYIYLISQDWVGLDVQSTYTPHYSGSHMLPKRPLTFEESEQISCSEELSHADRGCFVDKAEMQPCSHRCANKAACGHECCKVGRRKATSHNVKPARPKPNSLAGYTRTLKSKLSLIPAASNVKRLKVADQRLEENDHQIDLQQFAYTPRTPVIPSLSKKPSPQKSAPRTPNCPGEWTELEMYQKYRKGFVGNSGYTDPKDLSYLPDIPVQMIGSPLTSRMEQEFYSEDYGDFCLQKENVKYNPYSTFSSAPAFHPNQDRLPFQDLSSVQNKAFQHDRQLCMNEATDNKQSSTKYSEQQEGCRSNVKWIHENPNSDAEHRYGKVVAWVSDSAEMSDIEWDDWHDQETPGIDKGPMTECWDPQDDWCQKDTSGIDTGPVRKHPDSQDNWHQRHTSAVDTGPRKVRLDHWDHSSSNKPSFGVQKEKEPIQKSQPTACGNISRMKSPVPLNEDQNVANQMKFVQQPCALGGVKGSRQDPDSRQTEGVTSPGKSNISFFLNNNIMKDTKTAACKADSFGSIFDGIF